MLIIPRTLHLSLLIIKWLCKLRGGTSERLNQAWYDGAGYRRLSQSNLIEVTKARLTINSDGGGNRRTSTKLNLIGMTEARLTNNSDGGGNRRISTY